MGHGASVSALFGWPTPRRGQWALGPQGGLWKLGLARPARWPGRSNTGKVWHWQVGKNATLRFFKLAGAELSPLRSLGVHDFRLLVRHGRHVIGAVILVSWEFGRICVSHFEI